MNEQQLINELLALGLTKVAQTDIASVAFQPELRKYCEDNVCGTFGKNYMCPPIKGQIDTLIAEAKTYQKGLIFQKVTQLEDSFDFEGMTDAAKEFDDLTRAVAKAVRKQTSTGWLLLGAGGCSFCPECALKTNEPCRSPENAFASLECYGIFVTDLLIKNGIPYNNGEATVSYAGMLLYN